MTGITQPHSQTASLPDTQKPASYVTRPRPGAPSRTGGMEREGERGYEVDSPSPLRRAPGAPGRWLETPDSTWYSVELSRGPECGKGLRERPVWVCARALKLGMGLGGTVFVVCYPEMSQRMSTESRGKAHVQKSRVPKALRARSLLCQPVTHLWHLLVCHPPMSAKLCFA